ncbi:unnamed protein product [Brachionus calyciflorus]|uniref:G-protein coupled receptors family 1 profile domain-containing protein n=1 Tax=Brachionus calyciflorus TaxID=104777 RepID=A0A813XN59_9BILA|nr:unnamed protein product [Brachionus calyciflorus]
MNLLETTREPSNEAFYNQINQYHLPYPAESYEDYLDPSIPKYIPVVLLVIGLFGNALSILVFNQKSMKKNSTFIYLGILCYIDILVLLFGLGDIILIVFFKLIIRNQSIISCRMHTFLTYLFTHLSSFILASVSVDRAIATNFISFSKFYCTQKTAQRIIIILFFLSFSINVHTLFFLGYEDKDLEGASFNLTLNESNNYYDSPKYNCASLSGTIYDNFMNIYFLWIDLIVYAILPFLVMLLSSFFILRVIFMSNKRLENNLPRNSIAYVRNSKGLIETEGSTRREKSNSFKGKLRRSLAKDNSNLNASNRQINTRLSKTIHLTYTLISINALFICLVSPLVIVLILIKGKEKIVEHKSVFNILYLLAYSNHSFNFIFYGLSSPPYRNAIKNLIYGRNSKRSKSAYVTEFNKSKRVSIKN